MSVDADATPTVATRAGRIAILDPFPVVDCARWPARAYEGEWVPFEVTSYREGHDLMGVILELTAPDGQVHRHRMEYANRGLDRWVTRARIRPAGRWQFRFWAFGDDWETWLHDAGIKIPRRLDTELTLAIGTQLLERASSDANRTDTVRAEFARLAAVMRDTAVSPEERFHRASQDRIAQEFRLRPAASVESRSAVFDLVVDRERAGFSAWYELFPRSAGARFIKSRQQWKSGTFRTAARELPRIAELGFDIVYLPPIHPIGLTNRKGRNNSLTPHPGDPGSPWAIGSAQGGHDAVHPDLGTLSDFRTFVRAAHRAGLEVAIDLALQASPDHPWVREHPEWFTTLPDGSIAFAENPPKKYQDIYPINFDNDPAGIRAEVLRICEHWIAQGVTLFRVDNPHTKPTEFWEWLIAAVRSQHPEVIFLAEAFTRPAPMRTLAKVGFQQSYSYFAWRHTPGELADYFTEVSHETAHFLRPNFFPTTPDILTPYLENGGRGASIARAVLAATGSSSWGMYSGFEILETAKRPDADEQLDNEKYEYRPRDWEAARADGHSIEDVVRALNRARREIPALHQLRNITIHHSDDPAVFVYSKCTPADPATGEPPSGVIVVVNTAAHTDISTLIHLDMTALGLDPGAQFPVTDMLTGAQWTWSETSFVRLDMNAIPAHVARITYPDRT